MHLLGRVINGAIVTHRVSMRVLKTMSIKARTKALEVGWDLTWRITEEGCQMLTCDNNRGEHA